jgi:hypothetical protein
MGLVERVHCKTHPEYAREYYRRRPEHFKERKQKGSSRWFLESGKLTVWPSDHQDIVLEKVDLYIL